MHINLQPTRWAIATTIFIYVLTLGILFALDLFFQLQCIFCLLILNVIGYNIRTGWRSRNIKTTLTMDDDIDPQWVLVRRQNNFVEQYYLQLTWHLILMPNWIVLHFKQENSNRYYKIIVWPNSLSSAEFRQLRVRLQH